MAEINFLPVCSNCGSVLYGEDINYRACEDSVKDGSVLLTRIGYITPLKCRHCGDIFVTITMPTELPFSVPRPVLKREE